MDKKTLQALKALAIIILAIIILLFLGIILVAIYFVFKAYMKNKS